jgi:hypothetical protein
MIPTRIVLWVIITASIPFRYSKYALFYLGLLTASTGLRADPSDLRYFATHAGPNEFVLHVKAIIDGSNCLTLDANNAGWEQSVGSPTSALSLNGVNWDWQSYRFFVLPDGQTLFPPEVDFRSVRVEVLKGRGIVACEPGDNKVAVYVDDMSQHPQPYDFILHFSTVPHPASPIVNLPSVHLKIRALIDGSDRLTITHAGAKWEHLEWDPATAIAINDIDWSLDESSELKNEGATRFLPPDVDFSTAKIVSRSGRDLVTARGQDDKLVVYFGDTLSGSDHYEIEISFEEKETGSTTGSTRD